MSLRFMGSLLVLAIPIAAAASSAEVVAFKDKSFCEKVATFFREGFGLDAELSKTVEWSPMQVKGQGPKTTHCSSLDKAFVDLDNDGVKDLVVKTTFCMKGAPSDSVYMFPADSKVLEQVSWQDMAPLLVTSEKFERTGGTYPLTALPMAAEWSKGGEPLSTVFTVQPFIVNDTAYVALTDGRREWAVITKYLRGGRFEDLCYLKSADKP